MKKELSSPSASDIPSLPQTPLPRTLIYKPQVHENNQCFVCAICRKESFGYLDCRDLETDLKTIEALCPNCSKLWMLCDLRKHLETCTPKKKVDVNDIAKIFSNGNFLKQLSQPQAEALQKARGGENRSTFQCPYCTRAKYSYIIYRFLYFILYFLFSFTVEHLCKHMEKYHLEDHPSRVWYIKANFSLFFIVKFYIYI